MPIKTYKIPLNSTIYQQRIRLVCLLCLVVGIGLRVIHLDRKVYWHDEVYTSMEVTANTRSELVANLFDGREVEVADLQRYQQMRPDRTLGQMLRLLGKEDVQHPPLFYVLTRYWSRLWGDSIATTRSMAVLLSLLVFPSIYWLCQELFASEMIGWIAIAIVALSPVHILYAQEAREYSLWGVTTLVSSLLFLRAMRQPSWVNWGFYSLSLVVGFYTFLMSGLVALGHGLYVVLTDSRSLFSTHQSRLTRRMVAYLISLAIAVLCLSPWLYFLIENFRTFTGSTSWTTVPLTFQQLSAAWLVNLSRILVDFNTEPNLLLNSNMPVIGSIAIAVVLAIYALLYLWRKTAFPVWLFVWMLAGSTIVPFILADLVIGGQRSVSARYLIPGVFGVQLALAYLLGDRLEQTNRRRQPIWQSVAILMIGMGITSGIALSSAETWWNKGISYDHPTLARVINASDRPVVISDAFGINPGNVVALSYLVEPKTRFILLPEIWKQLQIPPVSESYSDVFLLNLPDVFREEFETTYQASLESVAPGLWHWQR